MTVEQIKPNFVPLLDKDFCPAALWNHAFLKAVRDSGQGVPLCIALERNQGAISVFGTEVFPEGHPRANDNLMYVERLVKTLLWQRGGFRITIGGPRFVGQYIQKAYTAKGIRAFDAQFMGEQVYEHPFEVIVTDADKVPEANEGSTPIGRHLEGCRIGFDAGASDRKVAAVIEGQQVFSEEVIWHPS